MQTELTVVQVHLKFGVNPDQGKLVLKQKRFFAASVIALCVSGADLYSEGGYVFSNCQIFRTFSYPSLGISNPNREKPTCYRIATP